MIRPRPRAVWLFGLGVPLTFALIIADENLWPLGLAYLGFAIVLCGLDVILATPARSMELAVATPEVFWIGETGSLHLSLRDPRRRQISAIDIVCDVSTILVRPTAIRTQLDPDGGAVAEIPLVPQRRGRAVVERLWLRWSGPLGLIFQLRREELGAEIPVIPNIQAVRAAALQFSERDALYGTKTQRQQGEGTEFESLRDYMPGLDRRSIDWKHSARHRRLVCKEFQTERNHQIILAFDTGYLMSEPLAGIPKLDHAINAGLVLGYASLRSGDRIGAFGFDSGVRLNAEPAGGMQSFPHFQNALSSLEYRHEETNFTLGLTNLLSGLNRRSLVVLMTEFVDTITAELMVENVERIAARHLVVFVVPQDTDLHRTLDATPHTMRHVARSVVADEILRERRVVFERLRRRGVHCLESPPDAITTDLLNRYLQIKRQELI